MTKLIILRGPSASGKSTVASRLRDCLDNPIALLDFDIFRNTFLGKAGDYYPLASKMLMQTAATALENGYDVIIDGFYRMDSYPDLLPELLKMHPHNNSMFYFDVSLETTIQRHAIREKAHEFGEKELREWYYKHSATGVYDFEYRIAEDYSPEEAVKLIVSTIRQ